MNTYKEVAEVPFKPLNHTKIASTRRAILSKDLIPMLGRINNHLRTNLGTC